jgi:hypothetical protein
MNAKMSERRPTESDQSGVEPALSPIASRIRDGQTIIRPVSQVILRLKPVAGVDRFEATIKASLQWLKNRAGRRLPENAWERRSFELTDIGAQRVGAISLDDPRYWAARLDDACKEVPLRTWVTEIGVGVADDGDILFGTRLICAARGNDVPYQRTIPGFVKQILSKGPAELDGREVQKLPRLVSTQDEVDELLELLESLGRLSDVVVVALPEWSSSAHDAEVNVETLARELHGVAHVYVLTGPASFMLTDKVGRELSVFRSAVRIYRPRFTSWIDQSSNHPLLRPDRIRSWNGGTALDFSRWLVESLLARTVQGLSREERLPAFNTVRQLAAQAERRTLKSQGATESEMLKLFEQDNENLERTLKEQKDLYDGLLAAADRDRATAEGDANAARARSLELRHRVRLLEKEIAAAGSRPATPIPDTLDVLGDWCQEHLVGTVDVTNRALQAARKSDFVDIPFIYKSLLLLRDHYVPMRVEGTQERRESFDRALEELQLEESATGDAIKYAADQYSVQYGSARRPLDRHLKGRNARDRRFGFRLYFFWEEESEVAVVGWLPSHLDNRLT